MHLLLIFNYVINFVKKIYIYIFKDPRQKICQRIVVRKTALILSCDFDLELRFSRMMAQTDKLHEPFNRFHLINKIHVDFLTFNILNSGASTSQDLKKSKSYHNLQFTCKHMSSARQRNAANATASHSITVYTHKEKKNTLLISVFHAGWLVLRWLPVMLPHRYNSMQTTASPRRPTPSATHFAFAATHTRHSAPGRPVFFRLPSPSVSLPLTHATLTASCIKRCKPQTFIKEPYCSQSAFRPFSSTANLFLFSFH